MVKVLLVDDDTDLLDVTAYAMRREGFNVIVATDGIQAVRRWQQDSPDLVILDVQMPGMSGLEVCQKIRHDSSTPVILLTGLHQEEQVVQGFRAGADDYVTKPFSLAEVLARVGAQVRRARMDRGDGERFEADGVVFDLGRLVATRGADEIPLTPREGAILRHLRRRAGNVVSRDEFLLQVWEYKSAAVETRTVDNTLAALRKKIERDPAEPAIVLTVRGAGYRWGGA